jgi:hypothetical protein
MLQISNKYPHSLNKKGNISLSNKQHILQIPQWTLQKKGISLIKTHPATIPANYSVRAKKQSSQIEVSKNRIFEGIKQGNQ